MIDELQEEIVESYTELIDLKRKVYVLEKRFNQDRSDSITQMYDLKNTIDIMIKHEVNKAFKESVKKKCSHQCKKHCEEE